MKKTFLFAFLAFLGFAPYALAQGFVPLAPIPGLTDISPTAALDANTLAIFFNNLYKYLIGLAATLAVIQIIWSGLDIAIFHKDAVGAITNDKEKIYNAIYGLILVLSPVLVFSIINPSILNLSLNLPPINLTTPAPAVTTTQPSALTENETILRESAGGSVVFVFTVAQGTTARNLGNTLDGKQDECTQTTGGKGVILPQGNVAGGNFRYVCQTCPPASTVVLLPKGVVGSGARGACQQ